MICITTYSGIKKTRLGKWLLGVCGGYENPSVTEHCGHVFSEMQPYDPATAEQEAVKMVEMIREYWMKQAAAYEAEQSEEDQADSQDKASGLFNGFVLLNSAECDLDQVKANLLNDWNIRCSPAEDEGENSEETRDGTLVFEVDGFMLAASFIDAPIPDGEAEYYAQANYMWEEAVEVTQTHVAQIIVAVFPRSGSLLDSGRLYTKLAASCLKLPNAIGIYTSGTVFQPEFFLSMAEVMKQDDMFPLLNLVYFGMVERKPGSADILMG